MNGEQITEYTCICKHTLPGGNTWTLYVDTNKKLTFVFSSTTENSIQETRERTGQHTENSCNDKLSINNLMPQQTLYTKDQIQANANEMIEEVNAKRKHDTKQLEDYKIAIECHVSVVITDRDKYLRSCNVVIL